MAQLDQHNDTYQIVAISKTINFVVKRTRVYNRPEKEWKIYENPRIFPYWKPTILMSLIKVVEILFFWLKFRNSDFFDVTRAIF